MKGVVGRLDPVRRGARAELRQHALQQRPLGQRIARALHEQHRYVHLCQVPGAVERRAPGRVQRKAEEDEAAHAWQRRRAPGPGRSCGRRTSGRPRTAAAPGRAAPPRAPPRARWHDTVAADPGGGRAAPCRGTESAGVAIPSAASSQRGGAHERLVHARAGTVRQQVTGACAGRAQQARRNAPCGVQLDAEKLTDRSCGARHADCRPQRSAATQAA